MDKKIEKQIKNGFKRLRNAKGQFVSKQGPVFVRHDCNCHDCNCLDCKCDKKYDDLENKNEPVLYIILNEDVKMSLGHRMAVVSHLTSRFASTDGFICEKGGFLSMLKHEWLDSFVGYGNTVVLLADSKTLYENCMAHYDNVYFEPLIEDTERVAHHNWKLSEPKHVGVAFFGIKSEMPKWVRKLPLI